MSQQHTIELVEATRPWNGKYGAMVDYDLKLVGGQRATLTQKPKTPAPESGQVIFGDLIAETVTPKPGQDFEPFTKFKLKKAQPDEQTEGVPVPQAAAPPVALDPAPTPTKPVPAPQNGSQSASVPLDRDRAIIRQVALKCATELHAAELNAGDLAMPERVIELMDKLEAGFHHDDLPPF